MSQDFIEKIILLLLTATLTGFLVPYILKKIDEKRARLAKIIEAQAKFLEEIAQRLWEWRYMSIKVVYYASQNNKKVYYNFRKEYDEKIWNVLYQIRKEISISRRLVSESEFQKLLTFYVFMVELDKQISHFPLTENLDAGLIKSAVKLNAQIYADVTTRIDKVLDLLASELKLKVRT